ncbi:MAG: chemotaxis protein CheA [Bacillota bacterium]|nr:chemotaxis protein CheA [Bacillota bacterium]
MDMSQYLGVFLDETREHIQAMNDGLLALEGNPEDQDSLEKIFRAAHTLKGMSATMGFNDLAELTHAMESLLDKLRKKELAVTSDLMDLIFQCVDALETLTEEIAAGVQERSSVAELIARLHEHGEKGGRAPVRRPAGKAPASEEKGEREGGAALVLDEKEKARILEAQGKGLKAYLVRVELEKECLLKSARVFLILRNLEERGQVLRTDPPVEDLESERFELAFSVVYLAPLGPEEITRFLQSIAEVEKVEVSPLAEELTAESSFRAEAAAAGLSPAAPGEGKRPAGGQGGVRNAVHQTVRVDIEKLDALMNLVGELVINRSRLAQIGVTARVAVLNETIEELARITTDLQALVMKARMVPIEQVFSRFPRMVRDLSRELGKKVNLVIEGGETELDRTVVDEIGDPLIHLLRNAVDHGIETPEERRKAGKPEEGTVRLTARHEGNQVVVEVQDDGRGIDLAKIKEKAIQMGLVTEEEAATLSQRQLMNFIFRPGFTTAGRVTDVSGRGVGLDVVATTVQALNGTVNLESEPGRGSRFVIKLPLTLAIIQTLLVGLGQREVYAIPLENIEEIVKIKEKTVQMIQNQEYLLFRGQVIPILRLAELFATPDAAARGEECNVVVIRSGGHRIGVVVDHLIGQQEIVIKPLGSLLSDVRFFAGATILGDGKVALILDVVALPALAQEVRTSA